METYTVTLYGNRVGALINADYMVSETSNLILAKERVSDQNPQRSALLNTIMILLKRYQSKV